MNLKNKTLLFIYNHLKQELANKSKVTINVAHPDNLKDAISLKSWQNLAEFLSCKLCIPKELNKNEIALTFKKLNPKNSFHIQKIEDKKEKYGVDSTFFNLDKMKESSFLLYYLKALEAVDVAKREHILNLGINKADEFWLIKEIISKEEFRKITFSGIDHSKSAIEYAKKRFPQSNMHFFQADINKLKELNLQKADLIISIGTLQSPSINYKPFLMELVQQHLKENGALILGFPNSRWIDRELIYGAKVPNYSFSEMGLVCSDIMFAKKYLQQKKFRVTITGKDYLFITATKISPKPKKHF